MNKQNFMLFMLLVSSYAHAAISLETKLQYSYGEYSRNIQSLVRLDNADNPVILECEDLKMALKVIDQDDAGLTIESSLFDGNDLISQPKIQCTWGQPATFHLGEKNSNDQLDKELLIEITPTIIP